ncbi:MAG: N-formylglutamate amidohydrolase [Pseudomonadota bacterium]|nr:N-formylglutamate amidohydrolase [Pseudomonadota bacterium]
MRDDATEILGAPPPGALLFTCEHASNRVPSPWRLRPADRALLATHWGYDIGARPLTIELARLAGGTAALSRFSRLLIDPNRDPTDPSAVLQECDDGAPTFNRACHPSRDNRAAVHAERVKRFHAPFHDRLDRTITFRKPRFLCSVHSFTPVFRDDTRAMEAGVLFDQHDDVAEGLLRALRAQGIKAEANEPYSGKAGLIYSANRHGTNHGLPYLEIEVRQDLLASDRMARDVARRVWSALRAVGI